MTGIFTLKPPMITYSRITTLKIFHQCFAIVLIQYVGANLQVLKVTAKPFEDFDDHATALRILEKPLPLGGFC
jgi:hypothetical protein